MVYQELLKKCLAQDDVMCRDDLPIYDGNIEDFDDLIEAFEWVREQGFVPAISSGPHSVGTTLETMLGHPLDADSSSDFGFTEIKTQREEAGSPTTLFTKEPSYNDGWNMRRVVEEHGYEDEEGCQALRINLYSHEFHGLNLDSEDGDLLLISSESGEEIGRWEDGTLDVGIEKISDVCYITAETMTRDDGTECFWYNSFENLVLSDDFDGEDLLDLVNEGSISIEIRTYIRHTGEVRNHGTAFRSSNIYNISAYERQDLLD